MINILYVLHLCISMLTHGNMYNQKFVTFLDKNTIYELVILTTSSEKAGYFKSFRERILLFIQCLMWFSLLRFCVCSLFCCAVLCVLSNFAIILMGKRERAGCLTLFVFLVSFDWFCSVALPRGTVGWSAVCDCGIS